MSNPRPDAHECWSTRRGHRVHPIQARQSWRDPQERVEVVVRAVHGSVVEVVLGDGSLRRLATHDPGRVVTLAASSAPQVFHDPRWGLLSFETPDHAALVSVSSNLDIGACPREPDGGALTRPGTHEEHTDLATRIGQSLAGQDQRRDP